MSKDRIIVIGAGIAGLACAEKLHQNGYHVQILEARDRIGGRIHSVKTNDITLDFGASWIHGIEENPIAELSQQHKIETVCFNYVDSAFFNEHGQLLNPKEKKQFEDEIADITQQLGKQDKDRASEALTAILEQSDYQQHPLNRAFCNQNVKVRLQQYIEMIANDPYACELFELTPDYQRYEGYFAGDEVIFPQGYDQVIHALAQGLDIRLHTMIQSIQYTADGVVVQDQHQQEYVASQVVCTVPLGVLKQHDIHFQPALPSKYQQSIQQMGFGVFNKIFFELEQSLDLNERYQKNSYFFATETGWLNLLDLSHIYQRPLYFMVLGGEQAKQIEQMQEQQLWQWITQQLQTALPAIQQAVKRLWYTTWSNDPYSHGSYSFPAVGHGEHLFTPFQQAIEQRLWFAGEHCQADYAATVHGAYMSGQSVAMKIIQHARESESLG